MCCSLASGGPTPRQKAAKAREEESRAAATSATPATAAESTAITSPQGVVADAPGRPLQHSKPLQGKPEQQQQQQLPSGDGVQASAAGLGRSGGFVLGQQLLWWGLPAAAAALMGVCV